MKKYLIIISLLVVWFVSANPLVAQWGFTPTLKSSGECSAYIRNQLLPHFSGFATRAECEQARAAFLNFGVRTPECSVYYVCSGCVGHDIATAGGNVGGNANVNGTNQGSSFHSSNLATVIQDSYEQKNFQNKVLLGMKGNANNYSVPLTTDKAYNDRIESILKNSQFTNATGDTRRQRGREGAGIWFDHSSGKQREENLLKDGYEAKSGYQVMRDLGEKYGVDISNYISENIWNKMGSGQLSGKEVAEFHQKYDKFVIDVRKKQNEAMEKEMNATGENNLTEEFVNNSIDVVANVIAAISPSLTPLGLGGTAVVYGSAEVLKCANTIYNGGSCSATKMVLNTAKNTAIDVVADLTFSHVGRIGGKFVNARKTKSFTESNFIKRRSAVVIKPSGKEFKTTGNSLIKQDGKWIDVVTRKPAFREIPERIQVWNSLPEEIQQEIQNGLLPGIKVEDILNMPIYPDPTTYFKAEYIAQHLKAFEGGVTKFIANPPSGPIGSLTGTFVLPKQQADMLVQQSGGNIQKLEKLLGLEQGTLGNNPFRIDIENPVGLRMPDGNESGANYFWIIGGRTSGSGGFIKEAKIDRTSDYISNPVFK
jgi:hypothetical protein